MINQNYKQMKKLNINNGYRKFLLMALLGVALLAPACKKFLDVKPKDITKDEDFLQDYWDADFMLRGGYQGLQNVVENWFILGELQADWVVPGPGADKDMLEVAEHKITSTNKYTSWRAYYDLINRANYAIKNLPRVPRNPNYSVTTMRQYIGEMKWLRAMAYFHLVRNFGDVPLNMEPTDDISKVKYLAATSQDVVLDSVEADLKYSFTYCDRVINVLNTFDAGLRESPEQTIRRVTKATVCALQLEVLLWRNKYTEARKVDENFINNNTNTFAGNGTTSWMDIFTVKILFNEPLLQTNFSFASREINPLMRIVSNDPASGGKYMVAPSEVAMKTYNPNYPVISTTNATTDDIYRGFGLSYAGSAPFYNRLGSAPVIWKHIGLSRVLPGTINVPANVRLPYESEAVWNTYRIGDLNLLRAEMYNRLGEKQLAISMINSIRGRVGVPNADATTNPRQITTASTTEQIEDIILRERGLELGFEGRRWYDLVRIAKHRGSADVLINAIKLRAPVAQHAYLETRLRDTKNWYLPYNDEELLLNPNLKQKP